MTLDKTMQAGVEIGTDGAFPVAVAFVGTDYVMSGRAHPAFVRNGVDVLRVTVKYRTAANGEFFDMPEANVDAADAASYLAHMAKLVLAANGFHNGPHNQLVGAGRPSTRQLEAAMKAKNRRQQESAMKLTSIAQSWNGIVGDVDPE
jgi:hypothetical protein